MSLGPTGIALAHWFSSSMADSSYLAILRTLGNPALLTDRIMIMGPPECSLAVADTGLVVFRVHIINSKSNYQLSSGY